MRDIIDKRNELCNYSIELRTLKFRNDIIHKREKVDKLIKEQDKIYKKYEFYNKFIKTCRKEKIRNV